MSNQYFHKVIAGKNLKMGTWLIKHRDDPGSDKWTIMTSIFGFYKKLFVYNLGPFHVNNYYEAPLVIENYPYPINTRSHLSSDENDLLKNVVNELKRTNVIRKSTSLYSSPVKPVYINGHLSLDVNYSYLNSIVVERKYHIPDPFELVTNLEDATLYSKIVIKDVYHQYGLTEPSKEKTAFMTDFGNFEFNTLHQGLKNADEYIQEMFDTILLPIDKNLKIHLGEILVSSTDYYEHMELLKKIFWAFEDANIKIDVEESCFLMKEIEILGYHLSVVGFTKSLNNANEEVLEY